MEMGYHELRRKVKRERHTAVSADLVPQLDHHRLHQAYSGRNSIQPRRHSQIMK